MTETPTGRTSNRRLLLITAVVLVAVFAASTIVGFVGAPAHEQFGWEVASIFGTALGTTLLALATGWLAWSTRSEVRATQELAELTRRQQAAGDRPVILLESGTGFGGSPEQGEVYVPLKNVGVGPALRVEVNVCYDDPDWQPAIQRATVAFIEASSGQTVALPARFPEPPAPGGVINERFQVVGTYLDRTLQNEYPIITSWPEDDEKG